MRMGVIERGRVELSCPDVIPLDGAVILAPTVFGCIETAIGNS